MISEGKVGAAGIGTGGRGGFPAERGSGQSQTGSREVPQVKLDQTIRKHRPGRPVGLRSGILVVLALSARGAPGREGGRAARPEADIHRDDGHGLSAFESLVRIRREKESAGSEKAWRSLADALTALARRSGPRTAVGVLAELESLDARLRGGELEGVDARLESLGMEWSDSPSILRRVLALRGLLRARKSLLVEPNAVARLDIGHSFRRRFLASSAGLAPQGDDSKWLRVPLESPIRFLNLVRTSERAAGERRHPVSVVGFLSAEDLLEPSARPACLVRLLELAESRPVLVALFVFTDGLEPPPIPVDEAPWRDLALFWISGTFRELHGVVRRTRYEWLPGPSFLRLRRGSGGALASWCLPWDSPGLFASEIESEARDLGGS